MIWWLAQPSRAHSESSAIAELQERHDWLNAVTWRVSDTAGLCADFVVTRNDERIPCELVYPALFPDVPPQVRPREQVRVSGHQYGPGGELCLEYRPDNWEPEFTGAMMIESAYRLLSGEQPTPGETAEVASAHRTTVAQDVRTAKLRFVMSGEARAALLAAPLMTPFDTEVAEHPSAEHWLAFPVRVALGETIYWNRGAAMPKWSRSKGYFIRLTSALAHHIKPEWDFLTTLAETASMTEATARLGESAEDTAFLFECDGTFTFFLVAAGKGKRSIFSYRTLNLAPDGDRLPAEYRQLAQRRVAIVGCGSVGSKVAASLARAGVGRFVLLDGDLLQEGNLVRNDLDWTAVGLNKPDAVAQRIAQIAPAAEVVVRRIGLGGQESAVATDGALELVGQCDLIVEATADPGVFNLCAAVSRNANKPLVWGEVLAGGIGGIVARIRPGLDPVPHAARRQINQWCDAHDTPAPAAITTLGYGAQAAENAPPIIADDADVTVIAGHLTRFVLDLLTRAETAFPQSAYAIGLACAWIFAGPFDTWPIVLAPEGDWGPVTDANHAAALGAFVAEFFPAAKEGE